VFLWDVNSFYWNNSQHERIPVSSIRFEAVDSTGQPVNFSFDGSLWAGVGYNWVERGKCSAVEINRSPTLMRPSVCSGYNSFVNAPRDSDLVFWVEREGISQFRVLWEGQEIGRCDNAIGMCEVYLP
jgi:hypothetical protein